MQLGHTPGNERCTASSAGTFHYRELLEVASGTCRQGRQLAEHKTILQVFIPQDGTRARFLALCNEIKSQSSPLSRAFIDVLPCSTKCSEPR